MTAINKTPDKREHLCWSAGRAIQRAPHADTKLWNSAAASKDFRQVAVSTENSPNQIGYNGSKQGKLQLIPVELKVQMTLPTRKVGQTRLDAVHLGREHLGDVVHDALLEGADDHLEDGALVQVVARSLE